MIEVTPAIVVAICAVLITFFSISGRALWILATKLGEIVGELKTIGVLLKKGEEQFASIGNTQKEHGNRIQDHETRITIIEQND